MPTIENVIHSGENEHVEFKYELRISDAQDKAEFVRDIIALANAHGDADRYLLVGVHEKRPPRDVKDLDLDDAMLQQIIESYVEPRVEFAYHQAIYDGTTLGIVHIQRSTRRFHLVSKDLTGKDSSGKHTKLLERGQIWIRRGSKKSPLTAADFERLRDDFLSDYLHQPNLAVAFANGETEVQLAADWVGQEGGWRDDGNHKGVAVPPSPWMMKEPIERGTVPLRFRVANLSTVEARNVEITVRLPNDCKGARRSLVSVLSKRTDAHVNRDDANSMEANVESLLRNPPYQTDCFYAVFPRPDETYILEWSARAGNMLIERTGQLIVRILGADVPPTTGFRSTISAER